MKEEMESMSKNQVWNLVKLSERSKVIDYKWVYKTKRDVSGNIEWYKTRFLSKGYTKKEGIDYNEIFYLISKKDSIRIIIVLVAYFDLELHQMNVKITFIKWKFRERDI
jgi:hypothetical protein